MSAEPATDAGAATPTSRPSVPLQSRGPVQLGALYITRPVDSAVLTTLQAGRWAVISGPRHSGKSSLRVRTARALQAAALDAESVPQDARSPRRCATIELRTLQASSSGAAYQLLCSTLAAQLQLPAANEFWQRCSDLPPAERLQRFVLEELASDFTQTVILLDDLDALPMLALDAAEVLGVLQKIQETLVDAGRSSALTVAAFTSVPLKRLAGPSGADWDASVFMLPDFTRAELAAFAPALAALSLDGQTGAADWLDAVCAWTGGHPQLTQHVCQQLVARAPIAAPAAGPGGGNAPVPEERVERLIHALFLDQEDALEQEPGVREMAQALASSPNAQALLSLYRRLLSGTPVTPDPLDELQRELRLCGLCTEAEAPAGTPRLRPRCRLVASLLGEDWAREQEVRLVLQEAIDREQTATTPSSGGALLRGGPLKTAQAWARKNPAALRPAEIRVLLASLEAARSEVEAKHQSSAAALQRELRERTEGRMALGISRPPSLAAPPSVAPTRPWSRLTLAAIGLLLGLSLVALASAYRRVSRLEQDSQQAAARAQRAEQALHALQSDHSTPPAPQVASVSPLAGADSGAAATKVARAALPEQAAEHRRPPSGKLPEHPAAPLRPSAAARAERELGNCPVPAQPAD